MKTDELIALLAQDATAPVPPARPLARLALPVLAGVVVTALLVIFWLRLLPLGQYAALGQWWLKFGYGAVLGLLGLSLVLAQARPVVRKASLGLGLALGIVAVMIALGALQLMAMPGDARMTTWMGGSWRVCALYIATVSIPIYLGAVIALRRLAPASPTHAGAAAGLMAGGAGAAIYALHCPELAPAFVATWYTLGIGLMAGVGAIVGSRALRW